MRFTARELADALAGELHGDDTIIDGVATDSRALEPGALFVPIVAARDGHDFIDHAVAQRAAAYLTAREPADGPVPAIAVDDTMRALTDLGRHARSKLPDHVVGITGSVAKTSVKDLTAAVLSRRGPVGAALRSFNNEIGVPCTLANAPDDAWAAVVEMGARGRGHIAWLCDIARPTVAVVTAVAAAHTELFGSLDAIAQTKGELVEALPAAGVAVLNADDARVAAMRTRTRARVLTYGVESGDVAATAITLDGELRPRCTLVTPAGSIEVQLAVSGAHMAANAAAAAAVGVALDVALADIAAALAGARLSPQRMHVQRAPSGAMVIDDTYNANPASMDAALRALASLPGARRRVAVLGVMAELGPDSDRHHREIAARAADLEIELLAFDAPGYGAPAAVATIDEAVEALGRLAAGDAVLVKGSRVAALERLVTRLLTP